MLVLTDEQFREARRQLRERLLAYAARLCVPYDMSSQINNPQNSLNIDHLMNCLERGRSAKWAADFIAGEEQDGYDYSKGYD